jgi:hypothetical protein
LPIQSKKVREPVTRTLAKQEPAPQVEERQDPPLRTSVVVVSFNRAAWLRRCLQAVENSEERDRLQAIVVDNGSLDGSAQLDTEFPKAQFIKLPKNFGLTKALNLGWRAADTPYVFFLHEDTEVAPAAARRWPMYWMRTPRRLRRSLCWWMRPVARRHNLAACPRMAIGGLPSRRARSRLWWTTPAGRR